MLTIDGLPEEISRLKDREFSWLWWEQRSSLKAIELPIRELEQRGSLTDFEKANVLRDSIRKSKNQKEVIQRILSRCKEMLVSEDHFDWIKGNDRALLWLYPKILSLHQSKNPESQYHPPLLALAPRAELLGIIVLMLDLMPADLFSKQGTIASLRTEWGQTKEESEVIEKWLEPNNPQQWKWAWEYVREMIYVSATPTGLPTPAPTLTRTLARLALPQPVLEEEFRLSVLATADAMSADHPSERTLFIKDMKKDWSQKKYLKSGKAKKPLPLTESSHARLEWMAQQSKMKATAFAENMINSEYVRLGGPEELSPKKKQERKIKKRQPVGQGLRSTLDEI